MVSSLYTCHENHNLQVATYLNPKPTLLGLIFNFLTLQTQKMNFKKYFSLLSLVHGCVF
jgi:hypothetical protein